MKCSCGSTNIGKGDRIGDSVCRDCGKVLEEYEIISELRFEDNKLLGNIISKDSGNVNYFVKNQYGYYNNTSENRLNKAYKEINDIAYNLGISDKLAQQAKRMYKDASIRKFIQGRKIRNVSAALLYAVCRQRQTKHLLIDFSEELRTNLFTLGSIYLKYIKLFNFKADLIDPSWYITRFCSKLGFGDKTKTKAVAETANK